MCECVCACVCEYMMHVHIHVSVCVCVCVLITWTVLCISGQQLNDVIFVVILADVGLVQHAIPVIYNSVA